MCISDRIKTFHTPHHTRHAGHQEMFRGRLVACHEVPARLDFVLAELQRRPLGTVEVPTVDDATLAAAMQCAKEIASKPPVAIWGTKQAITYARDHSVEDSLRQMGWLQGAIWSNAHVRESMVAMKERRMGLFDALAPLRAFRELDAG